MSKFYPTQRERLLAWPQWLKGEVAPDTYDGDVDEHFKGFWAKKPTQPEWFLVSRWFFEEGMDLRLKREGYHCIKYDVVEVFINGRKVGDIEEDLLATKEYSPESDDDREEVEAAARRLLALVEEMINPE